MTNAILLTAALTLFERHHHAQHVTLSFEELVPTYAPVLLEGLTDLLSETALFQFSELE